MTEQEIIDKLYEMDEALSAGVVPPKFQFIYIYKGNWHHPLNQTDLEFPVLISADKDKCVDDFVAAMFDLSLSYTIAEIQNDEGSLMLLVVESKDGKTNITADVIDGIRARVLTEMDWLSCMQDKPMDEKELYERLSAFSKELDKQGYHRLHGVFIYKGEDWPTGESTDDLMFWFGCEDEEDFTGNEEQLTSELFDLSLAYSVKDLWHDETDLNILVHPCGETSNLTADTIERLVSLIWTKDEWKKCFGE